MGRQHVVVGSDDGQVWPAQMADRLFVLARGREAMGEIPATEPRPSEPMVGLRRHQVEVAFSGWLRPLNDPVRDGGNPRVNPSHANALHLFRSARLPPMGPSFPPHKAWG